MSQNKTPVVFTGKAGEYFGIWIVNLLLSIVTFGIYSAWAKVRRKKYFYNNTLVDGVGFDYHARPIAILKGRIIAVVLFVLYSTLSKFNPLLGMLLFILLLIAVPWIVVRGMMFNARNSSHRGLRFDFDGSDAEAAKVFIGYPLLILVTLGLAMPFAAQRTSKFVFDHHKFGLSHFKMDALVKDFYIIYLKLIGILIVIGLVFSLGLTGLVKSYMPKHTHLVTQAAYLQASTAHPSAMQGDFIKVANVGDNTANTKKDPLAGAVGDAIKMLGGALVATMIFTAAFFYALIIFLIAAYMKSRTGNLILNHTTLDHIGFFSNQRMRDLFWLYLTNTFVLIFTLGLATPWVQIRMARYRLQHLALTGETDWDKFVGEKKEASRAVGEEIADMFDVDLSFGF